MEGFHITRGFYEKDRMGRFGCKSWSIWLNNESLECGEKVLAVTRLEKYHEHINDHQIQNNEAFASNGYVLAVYEMDDLGKTFQKFFDGVDGTRPWINKDPLAIVKLIDKNIQEWDRL